MEQVMGNLKRFAVQHGLSLITEGEVGFGRECVGFLDSRENYVEYNPVAEPDYDYVQELYDGRFYSAKTSNAYHKHNCLCVLGHGDEALKELNQWIINLENEGELEVKSYKTGATGMQALFTGTVGYALKFK